MYPNIQNKVNNDEHSGGLSIFLLLLEWTSLGMYICGFVKKWHFFEICWSGLAGTKSVSIIMALITYCWIFFSSSKILGFLENLSHSQVAAAKTRSQQPATGATTVLENGQTDIPTFFSFMDD